METIFTPHPLRTIILRYDRTVTAPSFETLTLQHYQDIHDRTQQLKERVQKARQNIPAFLFQMERLGERYREARRKFDHLKDMYPTNSNKDIVRDQLKTGLAELSEDMNELADPLIDEVYLFYEHDDYVIEQDGWMDEIAFPQFSNLIGRYKECSIDVSSFDRDLEDFRHTLAFVKEQEGKYLDAMNKLIEDYSDLNNAVDRLFIEIEEYDITLLEWPTV